MIPRTDIIDRVQQDLFDLGAELAGSKTIKIKPLCVCQSCGADVVPSPKEAGTFLMKFRKTPYDTNRLKEVGKLGGRPRKNKTV